MLEALLCTAFLATPSPQAPPSAAATAGFPHGIDPRGAVQSLTIGSVGLDAFLKASNTDAGDAFGLAVAVSGDTVAVGAAFEQSAATGVDGDESDDGANASGAVYVFRRSGSTWVQEAYLKASNTEQGDRFGYAVALEGDTLAVGAIGEDSNGNGPGANQSNNSANGAGAVYVFTRSGSTWSQEAYLKAARSTADDSFGWSLSLSGETLVVGARGESSAATGVNGDQTDESAPSAGAAFVFTRSGTSWSQEAYLKASNTQATDRFGTDVALSGDLLAVGAQYEDSQATGQGGNQGDNSAMDAGAVYVFERSGTSWSQQAYLKATNTDAEDHFGRSVALEGDTLLVGATGEDSASGGVNGDQGDDTLARAGAAYVFTRSGTSWSLEAYLKASFPDAADTFGHDVDLSGDAAVVGAREEDGGAACVDGDETDDSVSGAGAVFVFERSGTSWSQASYLKHASPDNFDYLGHAVSVDGDVVVAGCPNDNSASTGVGGDPTDDSVSNAGAAFVFDLDASAPVPFAFCFGDGSGTACPCGGSGAAGAGCATTSTTGAVLSASGVAIASADSFALQVSGIPGPKLGLCIVGTSALSGGNGNPVGDGLLCLGPQLRSQVIMADAGGNLTMSDWRGVPFSAYGGAATCGVTNYYQWWFRDPMNPCSGQGFNFSNGVGVVWR